MCPGLDGPSGPKSWTNLLPQNDELTFQALKLDQARIDRLTHLDICVPPEAFFGGRMGFSSSVEFPVLQQLYIDVSWRMFSEEPESDITQWFRMPQLRRLSVCNFKIMRWQKLTFPEHSPLINTIELMTGDYGRLNNFFDPIASPLLPYAKTLESLTITAKELGGKETHCINLGILPMSCRCNWQGVWFLAFLKTLVELCVPFRSFAKAMIISYPPLLRDLILVGCLRDHYFEPEMVVKLTSLGLWWPELAHRI